MNPRCLTKAEIADAVARCSLASPHTVPLLEAAYHGVITLAGLGRDRMPPLKQMERCRLPALIVLGDDCADGTDTGPAGWAAVPRLLRWAHLAVIHGAGARVQDYREAVLTCLQVRKLVLVECGTAHLWAWHQAFAHAGVPTVNLVPSDGVHPVSSSRGTVH